MDQSIETLYGAEKLLVNQYQDRALKAEAAALAQAAEIERLKADADASLKTSENRTLVLYRIIEQICQSIGCEPPDKHGYGCADLLAAIIDIERLKAALAEAPHDSRPDRYGDPECGLLRDKSRVGSGKCTCWKSEIAALSAASDSQPGEKK